MVKALVIVWVAYLSFVLGFGYASVVNNNVVEVVEPKSVCESASTWVVPCKPLVSHVQASQSVFEPCEAILSGGLSGEACGLVVKESK